MNTSATSIMYMGHPILRKKAEPVLLIDDTVRHLIAQLKTTVQAKKGLGLAAPQLGVSLAIFVACFPDENRRPGAPEIFINPKLSQPSEQLWTEEEGCLSLPSVYAPVTRPYAITITFQDEDGVSQTKQLQGWDAKIVMHENDHLNGVLFVDRTDKRDKKRLMQSIDKLQTHVQKQIQQHHVL